MSTEEPKPAKTCKIDDESRDADYNMYRAEVQQALEELDAYQSIIDEYNQRASDEVLKVEQKYNKIRRPYYSKRNRIAEKIQNFWMTSFVNHPQIFALLNKDEEECLKSLRSLDVEDFDDVKSGLKIIFKFKTNAFFKNSELVKEYHFGETSTTCSTKIQWKPGKNLVLKAKQEQKRVKCGSKRKMVPDCTFFQWFCTNGELANDDEIAELLKDEMWPNPLQFFLADGVVNGVVNDDGDKVEIVDVEGLDEEVDCENESSGVNGNDAEDNDGLADDEAEVDEDDLSGIDELEVVI